MTVEETTAPQRRYKGADPQERMAERREKILSAALELFGTRGFRATTLAMLSANSGVPHRYLIQIFPEKEEILWEIYQGIFKEVREAVLAVPAPVPFDLDNWIRANIACACSTMAADLRKARITFLEVVGISPAFETRRRGVIRDFARLIRDSLHLTSLPLPMTDEEVHYGTIGLVGVFNEIMVEWMLTEASERPPIEAPVGYIHQMYVGAFIALMKRANG
jgi:AcrR family transcriptional regulator